MSSTDTVVEADVMPAVRTTSLVLAVSVLTVSLVVFVGGWLLGIEFLKRLLPPFAAMVPSTALSFCALGGVLVHHFSTNANPDRVSPTALIAAALVGLAAAIDLFVVFTDTAHSVDLVLWPALATAPDSMSPATAISFILASASVAMASGWRWKSDIPFVACATAGLLIAMVAVVGYAFDARALYQVSIFTAMALHTAVAFVFLFVAILLLRPRSGWLGTLLAPESGSAAARRLFPLILLLPFASGIAALTAEKAGLFQLNFSFCLLALVSMVLLAIAVLRNARIENRTERQMAAAMAELKVAVADRDLLLRELYHRVKNNLQQINALLHMETTKLSDPRARDSFRATAGRIYALGTVHRLLISSPSVSNLSTEMFLKDLCGNIAASFDAAGNGITVHVDATDIPINIDAAMPIGMLVNEFVTNALKHAFPGRRAGDIHVTFGVVDDGRAQLTIADNGVGIPRDIAEPADGDGTGSRIIRSFVKQIRGAMTVRVDAGTAISIDIPADFYRRD